MHGLQGCRQRIVRVALRLRVHQILNDILVEGQVGLQVLELVGSHLLLLINLCGCLVDLPASH